MFGKKRIYTGGFVAFTIGSAITSLAMDPIQVILFRVVQGIGAGIILTSSVALIVDATPKNELGFALSINSFGFRFGAMAGLTVSGARVYMMLFGAGIGIFSSPNLSSIMSFLSSERRGIGSALRVTFFNLGFAVSFNLAILVISFTVPYALVTQIVGGYTTTLYAEKDLFLQGLKATYLWLAVLNTVAIVPSVLRGRGPSVTKLKEPHKIVVEM
jgi:hypothetical protein